MNLSERQLLLLDELMYFSKSVSKEATIKQIINNYKKEDGSYNIPAKDLSGGITVEQAEEILKEIENDEQLRNLKLVESIDGKAQWCQAPLKISKLSKNFLKSFSSNHPLFSDNIL